MKKGEGQELWTVLQHRSAREGGAECPVLGAWGAIEGSGDREREFAEQQAGDSCVLDGVWAG